MCLDMEDKDGPTMIRYKMKIYRADEYGPKLWNTCDIFAEDDATAKKLVQGEYDKRGQELVQQQKPKIDDPNLVNFSLYDGDRLVMESLPLLAVRP
jgi:hypothetical protein